MLKAPAKWLLPSQLESIKKFPGRFAALYGAHTLCPLTLSADFSVEPIRGSVTMDLNLKEAAAAELCRTFCKSPCLEVFQHGWGEMVMRWEALMMDQYFKTDPHTFYTQNVWKMQGFSRYTIWGYVSPSSPSATSSSSSSSASSSSSSSSSSSAEMNFTLFNPPIEMPNIQYVDKKADKGGVGIAQF